MVTELVESFTGGDNTVPQIIIPIGHLIADDQRW